MDKRICCRTIISINDKLLCMYHNRYGEIYWNLPGGGQELNETIEDCAIRETKEEFNIDIKLERLLIIYEDNDSIQFIFKAKYIFGEIKLPENSVEFSRSNKENIYSIQLIDYDDINKLEFRPIAIKDILTKLLKSNFKNCMRPVIISNYIK